jgi:hypothetical protein
MKHADREIETNAETSIITLSHEWRIRPYDALQWVLERRLKPFAARPERFQPRAYARTRAGLQNACNRLQTLGHCLDTAPLAALPATYDDWLVERAGQPPQGAE